VGKIAMKLIKYALLLGARISIDTASFITSFSSLVVGLVNWTLMDPAKMIRGTPVGFARYP
jgi:hypothetical protein